MGRPKLNYTHGDAGSRPADGTDFQTDDAADPQTFDWYINELTSAIDALSEEFDELDSNDDGIVDEADSVTSGGTLKGNLNAADGETVWNETGGYIPQSRLENDDVTITAGTGIASAGTTTLGNAVTIDVDDTRYILESGDTMSGTLTLEDGSTAASRDWVNSNADVPQADNADTIEGRTIYTQPSAPSDPSAGDIWIDTS